MKDFELIKFVDREVSIDAKVETTGDSLWLSLNEIAELFGVQKAAISKHISNIYSSNELSKSTVSKMETVQIEGERKIKRSITIYNLDLIISVGYRVNTKKGIIFRQWANSVLKDYLLKGYAINEKRITALNKTIDIQSKIIANAYEIDANEVKKVVDSYTEALTLLDNYDHQCIPENKKEEEYVQLTYSDIKTIITNMEYAGKSEVFGVEKEQGKLEGILAAVYQNVFGQEVYPTIKDKAAHLLYFMIKDHPFTDGCKRIAAASFLMFLAKNKILSPSFSSQTLVAVTLLTAESNPDDIESIIKVIVNIL